MINVNDDIQGVSLNLRLEYLDEILETKPKVKILEVITENLFSKGPHLKKIEKLRQDYELSFHCVGMNIGGVDQLDKNYLQKIKELANIYRPMHISDHLCFQANEGIYHHDLLPIPFNEQGVKHVSVRINEIQDYLGERILIENLSYYIQFKSSTMSEIDFLNKVIARTDSYLLVDLNNFWVNYKNNIISDLSFLDTLDLTSVKELHIAGPENLSNLLIDTHGTFPDRDVIELARNFNKLNIPIIYERDNNLTSFEFIVDEVLKLNKEIYV